MRLKTDIKYDTYQFKKMALFRFKIKFSETAKFLRFETEVLDQKKDFQIENKSFRLETEFLHWK